MVERQVISIPFSGGLETKTDPKQVPVGKLLSLINGIFTTGSEIRKRYGTTALSTTVLEPSETIESGNSIFTLNNELFLSDSTYLYGYSPLTAAWTQTGVKKTSTISASEVGSGAYQGCTPQMAIAPSNVAYVTWFQSNVSYFNGNSTATGTSLSSAYYDVINDTLISSSSINTSSLYVSVTPVYYNSLFYVLKEERDSTKAITYAAYNLTPSSTIVYEGTMQTLGTNTTTVAKIVSTGSAIFMLYDDSSGYPNLGLYTGSSPHRTGNVVLETSTFTASCLFLDTANSYVYAVWFDGTNIKAAVYDYSLNQIAAPQSVGTILYNHTYIRLSGSITASNSATITMEVPDPQFSGTYAPTTNVIDVLLLSRSSGTLTGVIVSNAICGVAISSNPFTDAEGNVYFGVRRVSNLQASYFIIQRTIDGKFHVVAKYSWLTGDTANVVSTWYSAVTNTAYISDSMIKLPGLMQINALINNGVISATYNTNMYNLALNTKMRNTTLANNLNLTGGVVSYSDAAGVYENGFNLFPEVFTLSATTATGGALTANGTYFYVLTYEYTDDAGNLHRSAPSEASQVTLSGGENAVLIDYEAFNLTELINTNQGYPPGLVNIYRTAANVSTGVYFKVASYYANYFPVTYTDKLADSVAIGNEQLYTVGGEVENIAPPPASLMTSYNNRLILVDSENPLTWWFSKQVLNGFPVEFSDLFTQNIDQRGGNITAIAVMDVNLILFKQNTIFYVNGYGPSPSGSNNDFTYPQISTTDVGCSNQDSIVVMPIGIMFQSQKGIYLLDRSLQTSYIGAPVEQYNTDTVVSAVLVPNTTQVRFSMLSGAVLVFDYFYNQWSVFTGLSPVDSTVFEGQAAILQGSGLVLVETPGTFTDNGAAISLSLTTAWMSFAQIQGFQRVRRMLVLGKAISTTMLDVSVSYDFTSNVNQTDSINISTAATPLQYRIDLAEQKCQAIQFTISDTPYGTLGEGVSLSGLAFEVGAKKGTNKLPVSQIYG